MHPFGHQLLTLRERCLTAIPHEDRCTILGNGLSHYDYLQYYPMRTDAPTDAIQIEAVNLSTFAVIPSRRAIIGKRKKN